MQFFNSFGVQCAVIAGAQFVALAEIRTENSDNHLVFSYESIQGRSFGKGSTEKSFIGGLFAFKVDNANF